MEDELEVTTDTDQEAADLWAEFDEADGGTGAGDIGGGDEGDVDDDTTGADFGETDGDAGDTGTDGTDDTGADEGDEDTSAAAQAANPLWDTAPPELRTEFQRMAEQNAKLLQKERSASGRATGFQRRYEELLKQAEPRLVTGDQPSTKAVLSGIEEDYPEIAAPVTQAFEVLQGQIAQLSAAEEGRRAAAQTELAGFIEEQTNSLKSQHPDYEDVLEKNAPTFVAWIDDQPRAVRDAFQRNSDTIVDAAQAATVIGMFKDFIGAGTPPAAEDPRTPRNSTLANRRERQLGSTASLTKANRRPTVSGIPENGDPQAIWDAIEASEARKR